VKKKKIILRLAPGAKGRPCLSVDKGRKLRREVVRPSVVEKGKRGRKSIVMFGGEEERRLLATSAV